MRQVKEPASGLPQRICRHNVTVRGKIVEDDYSARAQFRHEDLGYIGGEGKPIHRALDHSGRDCIDPAEPAQVKLQI